MMIVVVIHRKSLPALIALPVSLIQTKSLIFTNIFPRSLKGFLVYVDIHRHKIKDKHLSR